MIHLEKFNERQNYEELKYNIESLLLDIKDIGITVTINRQSSLLRVVMDGRRVSARFGQLMIHIESLIDLLSNSGYSYKESNIFMGNMVNPKRCKLVDSQFKRYPLKDNVIFNSMLVTCVEMDFKELGIKKKFKLEIGQIVRHDRFGEGEIIKLDITNKIVEINFESGTKRLLSDIAELELIK